MPTEPTEQNDLHDQDDLQSSSDNRTPSGQESKPISTEALESTQDKNATRTNQEIAKTITKISLYDREQNNVELIP